MGQIGCQAAVHVSYVTRDPQTIIRCILGAGYPKAACTVLGRLSGIVFLYRLFSVIRLVKWYLIVLGLTQIILGIVVIVVFTWETIVTVHLPIEEVLRRFATLVAIKISAPVLGKHPGIPLVFEQCHFPKSRPLTPLFTATGLWADMTFVLVIFLVVYKFELSFRRKVGMACLFVLALLPVVANAFVITTSYIHKPHAWQVQVGYIATTLDQVLDLIIPSLLPFLPLTRRDHAVGRALIRCTDKVEAVFNKVFRRNNSNESVPSFIHEDSVPLPGGVPTIGSQPLQRLQLDSILIHSNIQEETEPTKTQSLAETALSGSTFSTGRTDEQGKSPRSVKDSV